MSYASEDRIEELRALVDSGWVPSDRMVTFAVREMLDRVPAGEPDSKEAEVDRPAE